MYDSTHTLVIVCRPSVISPPSPSPEDGWMDRSVPAHPDLPLCRGRLFCTVRYSSFVFRDRHGRQPEDPLATAVNASQTLFERHLFGCSTALPAGWSQLRSPSHFPGLGLLVGSSRPDPCAASPKTTKNTYSRPFASCTVQTPRGFFFFWGLFGVGF